MRRLLSWLGLYPDYQAKRRQDIEDVVAAARMDYLGWRYGSPETQKDPPR